MHVPMSTPSPELLDYLRHQVPSLVAADATAAPAGRRGAASCTLIISGGRYLLLKQYAADVASAAQHEHDGLTTGGELGLAPQLRWAEDSERFGPLILLDAPSTPPSPDAPLDDAQASGWLFLLLTFHHLPATSLRLPSSVTSDLGAWWQGLQHRWNAAKALPVGGAAPMLDALARVQVIANVHAEAKRALWANVATHPTHGDATPAHLAHDGGRPLLLDWETSGQGDPAMDAAFALVRTTLAGQLTSAQFSALREEYLRTTRDLKDAALAERLDAAVTLAPFATCVEALERLATPPIAESERAHLVSRIERALSWMARSLGVEVGDVPALVAPLRA